MVSLLHVLPLAVVAHGSFAKLPSGNGHGTAVFDVAAARVVGLREHVFQWVDAGVPTRDLLYDTYFGLRAGGQQGWLTDSAVGAAKLEGGVISVEQRFGDLVARQSYFAPFDLAAPALVMVLEVRNEGATAMDDVRAFTLHNLRVGEGDGTRGQRVDWDDILRGYVQRALTTGRTMLIRPVTPAARHTVSPQNPYDIVRAGELFSDVDSSGDRDDLASGFQFDLGTLAPGASTTIGVVIAYHPFGDIGRLDQMVGDYLGDRSPADLVAAERTQWAAWMGRAKVPSGLSPDEDALYRQQLAILRMGQSRERNDAAAGYFPNGQIVASLRPGRWDIAWVRDACLAIAALARAGYLDEAQAGLEFMLRATASRYEQYVGRPYRISVVRYFGRGLEESDSDANGPNVEFDGFGLFLWAFGAYLDGGGDPALIERWWGSISTGIADVLVSLVEPATGLLAPDSSIWESHWDNGGRRHYTYSNIWAVVGLERAAEWAAPRDGVRADRYRKAAVTVRQAIAARLITSDGVLRPSLESPDRIDGAVVEAFNFDVVDPRGEAARATLDAIERNLPVESGHGFKRNQNGDAYDEREWVLIDLRIAKALRRVGDADRAEDLWRWVRDQASANYGLVAELYDQTTGDYAGEVPMVGFGAGAFVLAAWDRTENRSAMNDAGVSSDGGEAPEEEEGGSCTLGWRAAPRVGPWILLGVAAVILRRRRR